LIPFWGYDSIPLTQISQIAKSGLDKNGFQSDTLNAFSFSGALFLCSIMEFWCVLGFLNDLCFFISNCVPNTSWYLEMKLEKNKGEIG
jgi:hypothetical protein